MSEIGVCVNYYRREEHPPTVRSSAQLALSALKLQEHLGTVLLVDGSPTADTVMEKCCRDLGFEYYYSGGELTFSQGYNLGWRRLKEEYVALMASDIFPPPATFHRLLKVLKKREVGCVVPYLSTCAYPAQVMNFVTERFTCEPSSVTLNLNVFRRDVLEKVGGLDESFSGGFNDVLLLIAIRKLGYRVVLVADTAVCHMGNVTVAHGTLFSSKDDSARFARTYPELRARNSKWGLPRWKWPFATNRRSAVAWYLVQHFPAGALQKWLQKFLMRREPRLTQYPASRGRARKTAV